MTQVMMVQPHVADNQRASYVMSHVETVVGKCFDAGTDLIVLPEMFATGFMPDKAGEYAEEAADSPTLLWMKSMAATWDCAVVGSVAVKADGLRNRCFFVMPDGTCHYYDKRHLFAPGGEKDCFKAGEERCVVEWRGVRWSLQVCYDLRFPVWSRWNGSDGNACYDAIIYVAQWPQSRMQVWDVLLRARAIENQCHVIGVNGVGSAGGMNYVGGSQVVDARGNVLARIDDKQEAMTALLDFEDQQRFREKFPVLADRDQLK